MSKYWERALLLALVGYATLLVLHILIHPEVYQWDFRGYYQCATAFRSGINPYDTQAVTQMAGAELLPFVYPPLTLFAFLPFTYCEYALAYSGYLFLKVVVLAGLIYLWSTAFLSRRTDYLFYALCLFGFNATIFVDLQSGNISLFEQYGLWLAFLFYLRRCYGLFSGVIVATALFKVQPVFFLCLLLVVPGARRWRHLVISLAAFLGVLALEYVLAPALFSGFIANAGNTMNEEGIKNPSTFSLARQVLAASAEALDLPPLAGIYYFVHGVIAVCIVGVSWRATRKLYDTPVQDKAIWLVGLGCCVFALISVRFKDYSYMTLIVPAYLVFERAVVDKKVLLVALASFSAARVTLPGVVEVAPFWWSYYPLLIAFGVWYLYIRTIHSPVRPHQAQPQ
ncbi:MAG TPA: glycosyltransferase family 87 protein [Candidatus Paceibacterota bacterium]|nr:glycosyltransferase family 87 protein [Verrucomicrobiota bacterium]HSA11407.1 glycosyltransferase family 87 protein [Candidatus Paceibacterota bacterium]